MFFLMCHFVLSYKIHFLRDFCVIQKIEENKKTILTDVLKPTYVLAIKNELLICPIFG